MATADKTTTLPWSWYSDPAVFEIERERIFRRSWQYVGRADEVPEPSSFAATRAGHIPVVLVRDAEGTLRAFLNVCRHRGSLVCEGSGRRTTLQCPYHAWTYGLDGRLIAAPRASREGGIETGELGLVALEVDTWGPFVFVNPDPDAETLADFLDDVSPDSYLLDSGRRRLSQVGPPRPEPRGTYDPSGEVERGQFHLLFPNTVINVMPGRPNLSIGPIVPLSPGRTQRFLDYFVAPDADDAWIGEMLAFDAEVGAEDTRLVERVQRGVESGLLEEGRLLPESERLVAHFQALIVDALGGPSQDRNPLA